MLTEGWDANTVTHILGVRAFGSQLLCEQVVGRGLRRAQLRRRTTRACSSPSTPRSTASRSASCRVAGQGPGPKPPSRSARSGRCRSERTCGSSSRGSSATASRCRPSASRPRSTRRAILAALDRRGATTDRARPDRRRDRRSTSCDLRDQRLQTRSSSRSPSGRSTTTSATRTAPSGRGSSRSCVAHHRDAGSTSACTPYLKDDAFPQMLLLAEYSHAAAERIHRAIVRRHRGREAARADPAPVRADRLDRRRLVRDDQDLLRRRRRATSTCVAAGLRLGGEARRGARGRCPRSSPTSRTRASTSRSRTRYEGRAGNYVPDFLIRLRDDGSTGPDDLLTLVLEVIGRGARRRSRPRSRRPSTCGPPAVNNWGGLGRWAFLEVTDPWDAEQPDPGAVPRQLEAPMA